jgi:hypothetical protein
MIQFYSIRIYLRANLTAQRSITKLAQVRRNRKVFKKQNTKYDNLYNDNKIIFTRNIMLVLRDEKNKAKKFNGYATLWRERTIYIHTYIHIHIEVNIHCVPEGMCQTSGWHFLC